jgi:plastocyanin
MRLRLLLLALATLALASCASQEADVEVVMLDNSFSPAVIEVPVNGSVLFRNEGRTGHNAIDAGGTFSTEDTYGEYLVQPGDETMLRFAKPGVYQIYCAPHSARNDDGSYSGMVATLIVGDADEAEAATEARAEVPREWSGETLVVPDDGFPDIQSAVDAAGPGDLVLIRPGTYKEQVTITTPGLTIRGEDRNTVILDGEFIRDNGVFATADGVAVENLTTKNYLANGVFWTGVTGYRGSYLTAIDNIVYGIYAFGSVDGLIEHSYASGSWDSGFYIGQCDPCNAMITDVVSEYNGLGYSGTNSSGNVYLVNSTWRYNAAGIVPNTLDSELLPPVRDVVIAGNLVHGQGTVTVPTGSVQRTAEGHGILYPGGRDALITQNLVVNNAGYGIAISPMFDANFWAPGGSEIVDNVVQGSGQADLLLSGPADGRSCFARNEYETTIPRSLGLLHDCDGLNLPSPVSIGTFSQLAGGFAHGNTTENAFPNAGGPGPDALDFDQIPGGASAPVVPAVDVYAGLDTDLSNFPTPTTAPDEPVDDVFVLGAVPIPGNGWTLLFGFLLDWVPWLVWVVGGTAAIRRMLRGASGPVAKWAWIAIVVLVPAIGVLAWALAGPHRPAKRFSLVFGGFGIWLVALVVGLVAGGLV